MYKFIFFFILSIVSQTGIAQNQNQIVGVWNFSEVKTSNPNCKDVSYFPIQTFVFSQDSTAELISDEGKVISDYEVQEKTIYLTNIIEDGIKRGGRAEFTVLEIKESYMKLQVEYECGNIEILFKKQD